MKIKLFNAILFVLMLLLVSAPDQYAERANGKKANTLSKTDGSPSYTRFNINKISTWIKNDGESDINQNGNSGFVYPKGTNRACVFQSGFLYGGRVNGEIRVGGSTYNQGQLPGAIINGVAEDPDLDHVRIYRVRRDYKTGNLTPESVDEGVTIDEVYQQYDEDWNNWPAQYGAPYEDIDGDGSYDPTVDIPGQPGADQTIWFVVNDLDAVTSQRLYGSLPMGIEMQATIFGYNRVGPLGSVLFRKYLIINKSQNTFEDFYVCMWSDPDVGDATDDYSGCDSTLSLGYTYNGNPIDATYGPNPPATGFDFFQGPVVNGEATDTAKSLGRRIAGKKNLGMSAFFFFINSDPVYSDPNLGEYAEGTLEMYNLFQGKVGTTGQYFVDPNTQLPTKITLAGDPITGTGWVDGQLHSPGDRRIGMVAGPFTMAAGDSQEVVVGQLAAGATAGIGSLQAITTLKQYDLVAQKIYDNDFQVPAPPKAPVVDVIELDEKIVLNWGNDLETVFETENHVNQGYTFQGYNVYQLPTRDASFDEAVKIATFDLIDDLKVILVQDVDPLTGVDITVVSQNGTDSGIRRYLEIDRDVIKNQTLVNGKKYYFAVTAYGYNPDPLSVPQVLENSLVPLTIIPHSPDPGVTYYTETSTGLDAVQTGGTANATVTVNVVDPRKVTGHEYEIFFDRQHYVLDKDGKWKKNKQADVFDLEKVGDVSPSTMSGAGVYAAGGTVDLNLTIDLQSPDFAYIDGVKLTFPAGITINSASDEEHCANGHVEHPVIDGQTVTWGNNDTTTFGCFDGSQVLHLNVSGFTPPLTISYVLYDDGYGPSVGDPAGYKDAEGTFQVTDIGYNFVTQTHWNVRDLTTGEVKLQDQTIIAGTDIYFSADGPGGSTGKQVGLLGTNVGGAGAATFDGIQVSIEQGSYDAPIAYQSATITRGPGSTTTFSGNSTTPSTTGMRISNYNVFAGTISSKAIDNFGAGSDLIEDLQQDYELRFTGVWDSTTGPGGNKVYFIKSGGQMGTIFSGLNANSLPNHPLNPNPGSAAPFLIRIPFEIWNVSDPANPRQVNLAFRDRLQTATADPFYSWNIYNRMYAVVVNSDYVENAPTPPDANSTWAIVFWSSVFSQGDKVNFLYANPLQVGKDTFRFTAPAAPTMSTELAKEDVEKVNVFPNPYYGVNSEELNKYQRFVTFNHLPTKATIRIFNLAGQLVRTIEKNSNTQFEQWDLLNKSGLPVASGLYIVYIDMPDLGTTKTLKAAIIQEQQILDRF